MIIKHAFMFFLYFGIFGWVFNAKPGLFRYGIGFETLVATVVTSFAINKIISRIEFTWKWCFFSFFLFYLGSLNALYIFTTLLIGLMEDFWHPFIDWFRRCCWSTRRNSSSCATSRRCSSPTGRSSNSSDSRWAAGWDLRLPTLSSLSVLCSLLKIRA